MNWSLFWGLLLGVLVLFNAIVLIGKISIITVIFFACAGTHIIIKALEHEQ